MPETAEQALQRVLDARKYLVLASDSECAIGEVIDGPHHCGSLGFLDAKIVVISETDRVDMHAQVVMFGAKKLQTRHRHYYRVTAE